MSHELSSLTLEDNLSETLSIDPDVLAQDWVNQVNKIAAESPWTTSNVTGSLDLRYASDVSSFNGIESNITGAMGSLSSGMGPYIYNTNTTGINTIQTGPYSISNTQFEQGGKIVMKGTDADIEINGKSMSAWMEKVEQRLNILTPNPEMEKEWDELRRLGERYRKLEKKCQEKSQMWETLKKMPPPKL